MVPNSGRPFIPDWWGTLGRRHLGRPEGGSRRTICIAQVRSLYLMYWAKRAAPLNYSGGWVRDGGGEERRGREGCVLLVSLPSRRLPFSDICPLSRLAYGASAKYRNENKCKSEEKVETERRERNVVNNVMKFLRWVETRRRHLRRDFMKSLNSPVRKDIIKFPTAKFAFAPPAHLVCPEFFRFRWYLRLRIPLSPARPDYKKR